MTIHSPLTRALIRPSAPAAVQLLTRQSVTPLSQTACCGNRNCSEKQWEGLALIPGWPTWLKFVLLKEKASYLPHAKRLEIPNNAT